MACTQLDSNGSGARQPASMARANATAPREPSLVNPMRLDLASLRLAAVCAKEGSLTRAAPLCNMSLMAASRRLRMLEQALGCTIFRRRRTSLELTDAGRAVVETAQAVVQLVNDMVQRARCSPPPLGRLHENSGRSLRGRPS